MDNKLIWKCNNCGKKPKENEVPKIMCNGLCWNCYCKKNRIENEL